MKICIIYGGTSNEKDVSIKSGEAIFNSIKNKHDVFLYDFNGNYDSLYDKVNDTDLVFNALHGGTGENGVIQKYLESKNIKFTGSNSLASSLFMTSFAENLFKPILIFKSP